MYIYDNYQNKLTHLLDQQRVFEMSRPSFVEPMVITPLRLAELFCPICVQVQTASVPLQMDSVRRNWRSRAFPSTCAPPFHGFEAKNAHLSDWKNGSTTKEQLMFLGPVRKDQYPNYRGARGHGWHGIFGGSIPHFANKGVNSQVSETEPKKYCPEASRKFGYE